MPQVKATFNTYKKLSGKEIADAMHDAGCSKEYVAAVRTMSKLEYINWKNSHLDFRFL